MTTRRAAWLALVLPALCACKPSQDKIDEAREILISRDAQAEVTVEEMKEAVGPDAADGLLVPVSGISEAELYDSFEDGRSGGRIHNAIDIHAPEGTPVVATADGQIAKLFESELGGLTVYQFDPSGEYVFYYAHLARYVPGLENGQSVERGDVLGFVGTTGNAPDSVPHLHFSIGLLGPEQQWWKSEPVNPYPLLIGAMTLDELRLELESDGEAIAGQ